MIELYGLSSPNVMKVLLLLEELELAYRFQTIDIWAGDQFTEAFKALNPNSKVPVLVDPDGPLGRPITVFESGAILLYLAEKTSRFIPIDPHERYAMLQWLMLQMASVGPMFGQATHFRRFGPEGSEYSLSRYVTEVKRLFDVLETRLSQSVYLGGAEYSIADMATYPWVLMYHEPNGVDLETLPRVRHWVDAITQRPASRQVAAMWKALAAGDMEKRASANPEGFDRLLGRGKFARYNKER